MAETKQITSKDSVKDCDEMQCFFQRLVFSRELDVYTVVVNKHEIVADSEEHQIIKIYKGATLTVKTIVPNRGFVVLKSIDAAPKATYVLNLYSCRSQDREYSRWGSQLEVCELEKIAESCDFRKVGVKRHRVDYYNGTTKLDIKDTDVLARLVLEKNKPFRITWEDAVRRSYDYDKKDVYGEITRSGEDDALFDKAIEFFKK